MPYKRRAIRRRSRRRVSHASSVVLDGLRNLRPHKRSVVTVLQGKPRRAISVQEAYDTLDVNGVSIQGFDEKYLDKYHNIQVNLTEFRGDADILSKWTDWAEPGTEKDGALVLQVESDSDCEGDSGDEAGKAGEEKPAADEDDPQLYPTENLYWHKPGLLDIDQISFVFSKPPVLEKDKLEGTVKYTLWVPAFDMSRPVPRAWELLNAAALTGEVLKIYLAAMPSDMKEKHPHELRVLRSYVKYKN